MTEGTLRVLLLERSEADAKLVERQLEDLQSGVVVERVESKDALKRALRDFGPDVVLCDRPLEMWEGTCPYALVRAVRPAAPIIVLLRTLDEDTVVDFLRVGPDDFVLKSNLSRLPQAIEKAIAARKPLTKLSPRQLEVMRFVAEGRSTREIADRLELSVKTVESHRGAMMKRLGLRDVAGLVRYAVRRGLVQPEGFEANP